MREAAAPTYRKCREEGLLVSVAGGFVLRFAPALIVTNENIDEGIAIVDRVLSHG